MLMSCKISKATGIQDALTWRMLLALLVMSNTYNSSNGW